MINAKATFQLNSSGVLMSLDIIRVVRYQKYCVGLLTCKSIRILYMTPACTHVYTHTHTHGMQTLICDTLV